MSNIITLSVPQTRCAFSDQTTALAGVFAAGRRSMEDVFWLKENAEFLNIVECTGLGLSGEALENWAGFQEDLSQRLRFFPQYYRFLLSIALDLEDLGLSGDIGGAAAEQVARSGLVEAEFSDLQRAEARRLLARRNVACARDEGLDDRLRRFAARRETFKLPNKKAAYELTHIVFYLSEYGRRAPELPEEALISLEHVGTMALLEQNMDLLAEVCVALRYGGRVPNPAWEAQVQDGLGRFEVQDAPERVGPDDYHEFLVSAWAAALAGDPGVARSVRSGRAVFYKVASDAAPLRVLSTALYDLGQARSGDWVGMRDWVYGCMSEASQDILSLAEETSPHFESFFEGFARAG